MMKYKKPESEEGSLTPTEWQEMAKPNPETRSPVHPLGTPFTCPEGQGSKVPECSAVTRATGPRGLGSAQTQ